MPTTGALTQVAATADHIYYWGLVSTGQPPSVVTADANSNIDCQSGLVVKNGPSARPTGLWTNGSYLLVAGDFYSKLPGSNFDHATYVAEIDLAPKQTLCEKDFQDVMTLHVIAVTETGQGMMYLSAVVVDPDGAGNLYTTTSKLSADGVQRGCPANRWR